MQTFKLSSSVPHVQTGREGNHCDAYFKITFKFADEGDGKKRRNETTENS